MRSAACAEATCTSKPGAANVVSGSERSTGKASQDTRAGMSDDHNTIRLAIGAFYAPDKLDASILDLFANGLATREICLAGTRRAFQHVVYGSSGYAYHERSALLRARPLQPLTISSDDRQLLATSGIVQRTLLQEASRRTAGAASTDLLWLLGNGAGLTEHLRAGAIALVVCAPTPDLQHRSSRILLRHSDHTVLTHEFTSAKPAISGK